MAKHKFSWEISDPWGIDICLLVANTAVIVAATPHRSRVDDQRYGPETGMSCLGP